MEHLAFPTVLSPGIAVLCADNPSEMTLDGTNTYLLFDPQITELSYNTEVVVLDPGPDMPDHLRALAAFNVQMILLTHRHGDHSAGIPLLHELTGAPVRAQLPEFCRNAEPLRDGEMLDFGTSMIRVLFTPGHTSDSVCFVRESADAALFTGDTVLGRGTTILEHPDGTLADYLESLAKLSNLADMPLHPAHGEQHAGSHQLLSAYLEHRESRLEQVRAALVKLGKAGVETKPAELLDLVYPDLDPRLIGAASHSLEAQLHYLAVNS